MLSASSALRWLRTSLFIDCPFGCGPAAFRSAPHPPCKLPPGLPAASLGGQANPSTGGEQVPEPLRTLLRCFAGGVDGQLGRKRRLVRIGDAGEIGDLAVQSFAVQALHIALDQLFERALHMNFEKIRDARA